MILAERSLILDGAMGMMIQAHKLDEKDFRGAQFSDSFPRPQRLQRCALHFPA